MPAHFCHLIFVGSVYMYIKVCQESDFAIWTNFPVFGPLIAQLLISNCER